jgi:hypothetical protein
VKLPVTAASTAETTLDISLQNGPLRVPKDNNRNPSPRHVLLMLHSFVGGHKNVESSPLGGI